MLESHRLPDHLHIAYDGDLHDTRDPEWARKPIRRHYRFAYSEIGDVAQLKATLRHGKYAWPGGYALYFITHDGAVLSFEATIENIESVMWAIQYRTDNGWWIIACESTEMDEAEVYCDHTGMVIE